VYSRSEEPREGSGASQCPPGNGPGRRSLGQVGGGREKGERAALGDGPAASNEARRASRGRTGKGALPALAGDRRAHGAARPQEAAFLRAAPERRQKGAPGAAPGARRRAAETRDKEDPRRGRRAPPGRDRGGAPGTARGSSRPDGGGGDRREESFAAGAGEDCRAKEASGRPSARPSPARPVGRSAGSVWAWRADQPALDGGSRGSSRLPAYLATY
jgi:hypothetical protein